MELKDVLERIPHRETFLAIFAAWIILFSFWGNSTLGYVKTPSIFGWWAWVVGQPSADDHVWLIPFVVVIIFWVKRDQSLQKETRIWWPALSLLAVAVVFHLIGFRVQQNRISLVAFLVGTYSFIGLVWGKEWLKTAFFPFFLLGLSVPLPNGGEFISLPLRMLATKITVKIATLVLGINVVQSGTNITGPDGKFHYDIAAACSGIRSLVAICSIGTIYAFMSLTGFWRRRLMILTAFPFAVLGNVLRLLTIIIAAEAFGQETGNTVHNSFWFSLVPYIPAILGVFFLGRFIQKKTS